MNNAWTQAVALNATQPTQTTNLFLSEQLYGFVISSGYIMWLHKNN